MDVIKFAILGIGVGAVYALIAQGLVLIYRGSGVVNFAHGALAAVGGYTFYELHTVHRVPLAFALIAAIVLPAILGTAMQAFVMRPLRHASPLIRVVATTGLLTVLVQAGALYFGTTPAFVPQFLPTSAVRIAGVAVTADRLWLVLIAVLLTALLWAIYRFTRFGLATTAVAERELVAESMGVSAERVALINWTAGGALAGLGGALVAPILSLNPTSSALVIIPALAAAMLGGFGSFPLTLLGGVVVGVVQSELTRYVTAPGWADASPFLVIVAILVVRGRALPLRGHVLERLPSVGLPRLRVSGAVVAFGIGLLIILLGNGNWVAAVTTTVTYALIVLSVVLVTGYAGQLSLAQYAFAGIGAFTAARLAAVAHWNFVPAFLTGLLAAFVVGVLFGLPALRTRGINLALVTLGLGLSISDIVFGNSNWTGGLVGTVVDPPTLFGWSIDPIGYPQRYAIVTLVVGVLAGLAMANIRRGRVGRRLLAVRGNERAAAALGISVTGAKLYAFAVSAMIAAAGGTLTAFRDSYITFDSYGVMPSINAIVQGVVLGIGHVVAAPMAGIAAPAGIIPHAIDSFANIDNYVVLAFGIVMLATIAKIPNGASANTPRQIDSVARLLRRPAPRNPLAVPLPDTEPGDVRRRPKFTLEVGDIGVTFGGVTALDQACLRVSGGEIVGLIGSNGAGKTTLIDVISGFTRPNTGHVRLDGVSLDRASAVRRARLGVGRSFQALELFEDMTVRENILAACDRRDPVAYLTAVVRPGSRSLSPLAAAAVREFALEPHLDRYPEQLSAGLRRVVGLVRAAAAEPRVLLLDEPAAGLDEIETRELGVLIGRLASAWGLGIVLVEHDMSLVMTICQRLVVLDRGQVIASGTTDEVAAEPAVRAAFLAPGQVVDAEPTASVDSAWPESTELAGNAVAE